MVYWNHPDLRKAAGWTMAIPVIAWFLPTIIRGMTGGPLNTSQLMSLLIGSAVILTIAAWVFPQKAARFLPGRLVGSRFFNWLILLAMIGAWAFLAFVIAYVASEGGGSSSGTAVAYAVILAALYLVGIGLGSFGAATWAWVSLRGGFEATVRKLNVAQLVVAAPGVLIALFVAAWLVEQGRL